jgi:hypothetical protein
VGLRRALERLEERPSAEGTTPKGEGTAVSDDERAPPTWKERCTRRKECYPRRPTWCRRSTECSSRRTKRPFGPRHHVRRTRGAVLPTTNELLPSRRNALDAGRSDAGVVPRCIVVRRSVPPVERRGPSALDTTYDAREARFFQRRTSSSRVEGAFHTPGGAMPSFFPTVSPFEGVTFPLKDDVLRPSEPRTASGQHPSIAR